MVKDLMDRAIDELEERTYKQVTGENDCDCLDVHWNLDLTDGSCGCSCHKEKEPK